MKELPIRKFTVVAGYLTDPVTVTLDGRPIGTYTPVRADNATEQYQQFHASVLGVAGVLDLGKNVTEATVDEVKKAIEPDKVRESRGRLTKGLGEVPGLTPKPDPTFAQFRPAPKPGKK